MVGGGRRLEVDLCRLLGLEEVWGGGLGRRSGEVREVSGGQGGGSGRPYVAIPGSGGGLGGGSRATKRSDETRGAQQPKLMHREEVGGWRWAGREVGR